MDPILEPDPGSVPEKSGHIALVLTSLEFLNAPEPQEQVIRISAQLTPECLQILLMNLLVGVEDEDPIPTGHGETCVPRSREIITPAERRQPRPMAMGDLDGSIGGTGVDHHDLVGDRNDRGEAGIEEFLLVLDNEADAESGLSGWKRKTSRDPVTVAAAVETRRQVPGDAPAGSQCLSAVQRVPGGRELPRRGRDARQLHEGLRMERPLPDRIETRRPRLVESPGPLQALGSLEGSEPAQHIRGRGWFKVSHPLHAARPTPIRVRRGDPRTALPGATPRIKPPLELRLGERFPQG